MLVESEGVYFTTSSLARSRKYEVGKFNDAMKLILGIPEMCEFEVEASDKKVELVGIQCISYAILKKIEETGCKISFDMRESTMILTL